MSSSSIIGGVCVYEGAVSGALVDVSCPSTLVKTETAKMARASNLVSTGDEERVLSSLEALVQSGIPEKKSAHRGCGVRKTVSDLTR